MRLRRFDCLMMMMPAGMFTVYLLSSLFHLFTALGFGVLILEQMFSQRVILAFRVIVASATLVALIAVSSCIPTSWMLAQNGSQHS